MTFTSSDLRVAVGGRTLFRGLSLTLGASECVALVGPSGVGKTTLLRTLALLRDPTEGVITLAGATPETIGIPVYRRRVAYVAQRPVLFAGGVTDNLRRPFRYATATSRYAPAEVEALLERVGLDLSELPEDARDLSEGQKQRVALVRALSTRPEVLLLDEPTSGLDERATAAVEALLGERAEAGPTSLLWVTHDRVQAARVSDRIVDLEPYVG